MTVRVLILVQEHVDMATTNVISALINIDQARSYTQTHTSLLPSPLVLTHNNIPQKNEQDVTEPWPLEMADLGGKIHPLNLKPGEVSARTNLTIHGLCAGMYRRSD